MPHCFSVPLRVRSHDCDAWGILSPVALLHWIQDTAEDHASALGFGYDFCASRQLAWVERRLSITIHQLPRWKDECMAQTWTFPHSPLVAIRNFSLTAPSGELLIEASCEWVIIDINRRRPIALKQHIDSFPDSEGTIISPFPSPAEVAEDSVSRSFLAEWSDVDFNGHVNNSVYLRWAIDSLPSDWHKSQLSHIAMSFRHECHLGDAITSVTNFSDTSAIVSLQCNGELRAQVNLTRRPSSTL